MHMMNSLRARTALMGLATALIALGGQALPAAAESAKHGDVETYQFVLSTGHDVTTFLMWAAEPHMEARKQMGFMVFIVLIILAGMTYFTKKKVWADAH